MFAIYIFIYRYELYFFGINLYIMKQRYCYLFFILLSFQLFAQEQRVIVWNDNTDVLRHDSIAQLLDFKNAISNSSISNNLIYFEKIPITHTNFEVVISDIKYIDVLESDLHKISQESLSETINYEYFIASEQKNTMFFFI